jgi:predicted RNA-binding Zn-ribbon protein involved in translation (DUF1610 family)
MEHADITPSEARCLTCGYLLRGLSEPVCPECGRAFDPADESTFDMRPLGWRRRRWIKRGAVALGVAVLYAVVGPRGVMRGEMSFTCAACGDRTTLRRVELRPPAWIPFRYPGVGWRGSARAGLLRDSRCPHDNLTVSIAFGNQRVVRATAGAPVASGSVVMFNGLAATIDSADEVLKHVMSPNSFGISVGHAQVTPR